MNQQTGEIYVNIEEKVSGKVTKRQVGTKNIRTVESMDPLAEVNVEISLTKNLGNYESLKISVGVRLPVVPADVPKALEEAKSIAETHLHKYINDATAPKNKEVTW